MAKFDKMAVLTKMGTTGMIPVFYHEVYSLRLTVKAFFSKPLSQLLYSFSNSLLVCISLHNY